MRHAKSSCTDESLPDDERPLNERGKRDATRMGEFLRDSGLVPDFVLTSTAKRARQTAKRVCAAGAFEAPNEKCPQLYLSGHEAYIAQIAAVSDSIRTLLVIGHNPDIEGALTRLTGVTEAMPTSTIACIDMKKGCWSTIDEKTKLVLSAIYRPKELAERD